MRQVCVGRSVGGATVDTRRCSGSNKNSKANSLHAQPRHPPSAWQLQKPEEDEEGRLKNWQRNSVIPRSSGSRIEFKQKDTEKWIIAM
jgi:hypothetical protein